MKTVNYLDVYEYSDGANVVEDPNTKAKLRILSHWNDSDMVVIKIKLPDGTSHEITVKEDDLYKAVRNATNV